jgi:nicotinamidase-related amidase
MEQNLAGTALLVMDMEVGILRMIPDATPVVTNVSKAISFARKNNVPVIYVVVGFRPGAPEVSMNNKSFSAGNKERWKGLNMQEFMKIHPNLQPLEDEVVIIKRRVSAFTGSDLEVLLRAQEIKHVVLSGFATSGVVLSTTREAADKDYSITILSDCCGDADEEVHRVLTTKVFPRQANVLTLSEWTSEK